MLPDGMATSNRSPFETVAVRRRSFGMTELFNVLLLALFPAAGNFLGGLAAEFTRTTRKTLSIALHLAAGIIFGVIAIELAPRSFGGAPPWLVGAGFLLGAGFYLLLDSLIARWTSEKPQEAADTLSTAGAAKGGAWMIYAAVAVDLFSDGLLIGVGSSISFGLALILALGQVTADIPEGFATIANFKDKGVPRSRRLLLSASFLVPVLAGALISYFVLRDAAETMQLTALAFTAGLLLIAASEEIIGEAHEAVCDTKSATFATAVGFVIFALVASYFEA